MDDEQKLKLVIGNIKRIRHMRGLSKKQVAGRVGLDYSNYCKLENNKIKNPKLTTLLLIAESLGVYWEEIFRRE